MPEPLTIEMFRGREQECFYVTAGEVQLEMRLTEVRSNGTISIPPSRALVPQMRQEAFSLTFCGPGNQLLEQQMYAMRHDELGDLGHIFIVPVDRDAKGFYYQAVFS